MVGSQVKRLTLERRTAPALDEQVAVIAHTASAFSLSTRREMRPMDLQIVAVMLIIDAVGLGSDTPFEDSIAIAELQEHVMAIDGDQLAVDDVEPSRLFGLGDNEAISAVECDPSGLLAMISPVRAIHLDVEILTAMLEAFEPSGLELVCSRLEACFGAAMHRVGNQCDEAHEQ